MTRFQTTFPTFRRALIRLRVRMWPILQTAIAAVAAWYAARLVLPESKPVFASIAAVIALGAAYGQRRERAVELIGGVVLGIGVADLLILGIGTGPLQLGLMVLLAMSAAVVLGGGMLLVSEAAVSAILLVLLEPTGSGLLPGRLMEALIGGGVALAIAALAFPLDPVLLVGRSMQTIFGKLGRTLEEAAAAAREGDADRAARALDAARDIDGDVRAQEEALALGRETARFSPGRRSTRGELDRYARGARHIDYAVRNARVLARHVMRHVQGGRKAPEELAEAIHDLSLAVWALAAEFERPTYGAAEVRLHAARAARRATQTFERRPDLDVAEIAAQVRSTAIDLIRTGEAGAEDGAGSAEAPTEELLADLARTPD